MDALDRAFRQFHACHRVADKFILFTLLFFLLILALACPARALAQSTGNLRGSILDPSGAVVPAATVKLAAGGKVLSTQSAADGFYSFHAVPAGSYTLTVNAQGFAPFSQTNLIIVAGHAQQMNVPLTIAVQQQQVTVNSQSQGVGVNPDENANAIVIKGSELDALSDDPDALQSELEALAGPAAGPNGAQVYIDGFSGGQIPPKSTIREIRINQNPFSAEFDRLGYGRIEILTKPGSNKFSGDITSYGNDSDWNTANALIQEQPSYYFYSLAGDVKGPITKNASYFMNASRLSTQSQGIVDAVNPQDTATTINLAAPIPSSVLTINPRIDFQLGKNNTVTIRDSFHRNTQTGAGVGVLNLPAQAYNTDDEENALQVGDTTVVNSHLLNETHFQWRRVRNNQAASFFTPTISVSGAFTDGGNNSGVVQDHQDIFELQNYSTATWGKHTVRFGARLRTYRDANYSTSGENGNYYFYSIAQYLAQTPGQYHATVINHPLVRTVLFDGALFYQDDWRWKPNFNLSYGLRYEGQNRIRDHADWAPRISLAWAPGHHPGKAPAKTVLRAGYGWFYNRFTVPNSFSAVNGAPYIIQAIHDNRINQQSYVVNNPDFYDPTVPVPPGDLNTSSAAIPYYYTVDHHFHAALDMQGAVGMDRKIGKAITANVTYLFTRGTHQYLSNNISAPAFDPSTYTVIGPLPAIYNYQFQSGGVYKQHEVVVTASTRFRQISLNGWYTFNYAKSDTQGVNYFPSIPQDPGLDYGRATFGIHNRTFLLGTYKAPHRIIIAGLFVAQSGTPYNITIGNDLTANNQTNARPTYGTCGAASVVATPYGCMDTDPVGKGEKIVPYGIGTGPANFVLHMRVSKAIGIGPRIGSASGAPGIENGGNVNGRGLGGGQALPRIDAMVPRKYTLTFVATAWNLLNVVNLGSPNGVLNSTLFGKSQSIAGGQYSSLTPGNNQDHPQDFTFTF